MAEQALSAERTSPETHAREGTRSKFITALAWVSILLAGAGFLASLGNSFGIVNLDTESRRAPDLEPAESVEEGGIDEVRGNAFTVWVRSTARGSRDRLVVQTRSAVGAHPVFSPLGFALLLAGSIGLLRRNKWARYLFVLLMIGGGLLNLYSVYLTVHDMVYAADTVSELSADASGVGTTLVLQGVFKLLKSLFWILFFTWLTARLTHPDLKAEFS